MDTKARILQAARQLYNVQGMKKVSARVICRELGISPGSYSYHFPDSQVVVLRLYEMMQGEIMEIAQQLKHLEVGVLSYLETHKQLFLIQKKYKFFFLNLFEILTNNEAVRTLYQQNRQTERQLARDMILFYKHKGILTQEVDEHIIERMINVGQILNNFWALDAELNAYANDQAMLVHYMKICCGLLAPYLTPDAMVTYNHYFEELEGGRTKKGE